MEINSYAKLKDKVEFCLAKYPKARDNDRVLYAYICIEFYPHLLERFNNSSFVSLRNVLVLPPQSGIQRIRAKIQNEEKKYLPTSEKVAKKRGQNMEVWRSCLGYDHC